MTSAQHRRVRDLFEGAVDRDPEEAREWVVRAAGDDLAVRDEVLSLLDHHSRAGEFLASSIIESAPDLLADAALAPGMVIASYTIVRELGRGGMGRVYLANDVRLGRTVALKALAPHLVRDPGHRERLRREARAAAGLTHPGICTVYALEEVDGELYIATEFVDGHTLREEIASGARASTDEVLRTARDLASALASAHEKGIVHRDLKPENVMRTRDGRLKILDFGLARMLDAATDATLSMAEAARTRPGVLIGTPAYMAPEQINGQPIDARVDVFAFGVLMYEFACGVHPFQGSTPLAIIARVLDSDAQPIGARCPQIPTPVADVIGRCLRKSPGERYASAAAVVEALEKAAESIPLASPHSVWWRVHQIVVIVLYASAAAFAWQLKDWMETPLTVSLFLALGAGATIGGVLRGHLVFTDWMNRPYLAAEWRRTARARLLVDLLFALLLFVDAVAISQVRALSAVFALSLALGIALAALVLEPATTRAAFGDLRDS
jgi:predicted Ser/Thr protein kinase